MYIEFGKTFFYALRSNVMAAVYSNLYTFVFGRTFCPCNLFFISMVNIFFIVIMVKQLVKIQCRILEKKYQTRLVNYCFFLCFRFILLQESVLSMIPALLEKNNNELLNDVYSMLFCLHKFLYKNSKWKNRSSAS